MSYFSELKWLIKTLFTENIHNRDIAEYKYMKHFPFDGYKAMSWCGYIITRHSEDEIDAKTINHETIHLKQAQIEGSWIRFYWKYILYWIKGNPFIYPKSSAYMTIPYEMEAYANQDNFKYCDNYDGSNLDKYCIKNRRDTYKKYYTGLVLGRNVWYNYIKTL